MGGLVDPAQGQAIVQTSPRVEVATQAGIVQTLARKGGASERLGERLVENIHVHPVQPQRAEFLQHARSVDLGEEALRPVGKDASAELLLAPCIAQLGDKDARAASTHDAADRASCEPCPDDEDIHAVPGIHGIVSIIGTAAHQPTASLMNFLSLSCSFVRYSPSWNSAYVVMGVGALRASSLLAR